MICNCVNTSIKIFLSAEDIQLSDVEKSKYCADHFFQNSNIQKTGSKPSGRFRSLSLLLTLQFDY